MSNPQVSICSAAAVPVTAALLETLADRIVRHGSQDTWRRVFLGPAYDTIRFEQAQLTLLASDDPLADEGGADPRLLAARLGGSAECSRVADLVLGFESPAVAIRAALLLQRLAGPRKVRTALITESCTVAHFEIDGQPQRLVIGAGIESAEAEVRKAAPGSVFVCGATYALADHIGEEVLEGLVLTESQGDRVTHASITLAPGESEAASTFVGLSVL